jgi:hypothetical protein
MVSPSSGVDDKHSGDGDDDAGSRISPLRRETLLALLP